MAEIRNKEAEIKEECKAELVRVLSIPENKQALDEENIEEFISNIKTSTFEATRKPGHPRFVLDDYLQSICNSIGKNKKIYLKINVYGFVKSMETDKINLLSGAIEPKNVSESECSRGIETFATCDREGIYNFYSTNEKSKYTNNVETFNKWLETGKNAKYPIYVANSGAFSSPKKQERAPTPEPVANRIKGVPKGGIARSFEDLPQPGPHGTTYEYPSKMSSTSNEFKVGKIPTKKNAPSARQEPTYDSFSKPKDANPYGMPSEKVVRTLDRMEGKFRGNYGVLLTMFEKAYESEIKNPQMNESEIMLFSTFLRMIQASAVSGGTPSDVSLRYFRRFGEIFQNPEKRSE